MQPSDGSGQSPEGRQADNSVTLRYKVGNAVYPETGNSAVLIAHIVNDIGAWGRGFVRSISARWPLVEKRYKSLVRLKKQLLGGNQVVWVASNMAVVNMFAQTGIIYKGRKDAPIRYQALGRCLEELRFVALTRNATVHMPRIGSGLAGGDWNKIEAMIVDHLIRHGVEVTVYDLPTK